MSGIDDLLDGNDALGVAAAIRAGEVSAREVVAASIARAEAHDPVLNAFVDTRFDEALSDADGVDLDTPFCGVPFVVKNLGQQVGGLRATRGSRLWADAVAEADSELVRRYRAAGFIVLGTTNSPELGRNASTEPLLHGPTRNPHRLSHSPGGSSGGTGAAVASGIVPIGHGNDGGGSIRIPAAACGLFGLKPTRARVTNHPETSLLSYPMGIDHVLTRSVRDSAAALDATAGPVVGDPYQIGAPATPWLESMNEPPGPLRIAISCQLVDGSPVDSQCEAAARSLAAVLEGLGHRVEEATPDYPLEDMSLVRQTLSGVPMAVKVDQRLAELGRAIRDDDLEPFTRMMYDRAAAVTGAEVVEALNLLETVSQRIGAFWNDHDLLLTPTLARPVPELGLLDTTDIPQILANIGFTAGLTSPFNLSGQPAASLPVAIDADGLPLGVQLVGRFGAEDVLLAVSSQVEQAMPWPIAAVVPNEG